MSELTDKNLEEWLVRASDAGPWRPWQHGPTAETTADEVTAYMRGLYEAGGAGPVHTVHDGGPDGEALIVAITGNGEHSKANAEFIAWSSPSNVSLALNEIRRLRRELAELRATPPPEAGVLTASRFMLRERTDEWVESAARALVTRISDGDDEFDNLDADEQNAVMEAVNNIYNSLAIPASPSESKEQP